MDTRAIPTPAILVPSVPYDRAVWEDALLTSAARSDIRLVGLVLAHHADSMGRLPVDGVQRVDTLRALTRLDGRRVRPALNELELAHFIRRPSLHTWERKEVVRPLLLTLPATAAVSS